jgi:hypothetical protein
MMIDDFRFEIASLGRSPERRGARALHDAGAFSRAQWNSDRSWSARAPRRSGFVFEGHLTRTVAGSDGRGKSQNLLPSISTMN